jgi:hypothetical protein
MVDPNTSPEQLLEVLGINDSTDLDIAAIAYYCGATLLYEPLTGCEANIVGYGDKAIITVNSNSLPGRQRFSAGHELGHWMRDRGQSAFGCTGTQIESEWTANNPETRANRFASDLLLPKSLFAPLAKNRSVALDTVRDLATIFKMSLTATAIRLVEIGSFPALLAYYERGDRKWFKRPRGIPEALWPLARLSSSSVTGQMLSDPYATEAEGDVRADRWFEHPKADRYYLRESCFRIRDESTISILWWEDEKQIIDLEEEEELRASRRADDEWGYRR